MTDLLTRLAAVPGLYRGRGDGLESGPFLARITVAAARCRPGSWWPHPTAAG